MIDLGPAARSMIECAAAACVAGNATEATLLLKRLAAGLRLSELAPPDKRSETDDMLRAIRRRTETGFLEWVRKRDLPEVEACAALEIFERCWTSQFEAVVHGLTPADTPRATLEAALRQAAERHGVFEDDLVARDIGWALVKAAFAAVEAYAEPLRSLSLSPLR